MPDEIVQENVSVPVAITSGIANAIGTVRDAIDRYTNSDTTTGPRRGGMGRSGGRGSGRGSHRVNKRNKRRR